MADTGGQIEAFDHRRYVPVLLTRQGERHALRVVPDGVKDVMTPLFVVHPVARDLETKAAVISVESHLSKLAAELANDWGSSPAFVDLRFIDGAPLPSGRHPVGWFIEEAMIRGLPLTPVVSSSHDRNYRLAAAQAAQAAGTAVALRLGADEWTVLGTPLGDGAVLGLLAETGQAPGETHVLLDLEDQVSATVAITVAAVRPALVALPRAYEWASVTVAGTGMPNGTAAVGGGASAEIARTEWALWCALSGPTHRRPSFGDYGVQHPDPLSNFDPRFMDSSAQLRYTIQNAWFVVRGHGVKKRGNEQIRGLAQSVVDHAEYAGAEFSWGDRWLDACARGEGRPGNQGLWRKVTTNHHLSYVVEQLASYRGP